MISNPSQAVDVTGVRNGTPVDDVEPLGNTFDELSFSHGHNLLTVSALRRWDMIPDFAETGRSVSVHAGGGAGIAVPNVEIRTAGSDTNEYQVVGPAVHIFAGLNVPLGSRFLLTAEYKISWADLDASPSGGGKLKTDALTHNLTIGIGFNFGENR